MYSVKRGISLPHAFGSVQCLNLVASNVCRCVQIHRSQHRPATCPFSVFCKFIDSSCRGCVVSHPAFRGSFRLREQRAGCAKQESVPTMLVCRSNESPRAEKHQEDIHCNIDLVAFDRTIPALTNFASRQACFGVSIASRSLRRGPQPSGLKQLALSIPNICIGVLNPKP